MGNRLLVADVSEDFSEDPDLTAQISQNRQARLCHQLCDTQRFQSDRFTTGIWPCDDNRFKRLIE